MGAKNFSGTSTGRVNYYGVSYGALSVRVKEIPEGYEEITTDELKSRSNRKEDIDLRERYVTKSGDYPYSVFYQSIEGTIVGISKKEPQGMSKMLELEILDSDGETSYVSMNLYSKYTENLLNRLTSLESWNDKNLTLSPYSISNTFPDKKTGKPVSIYNQGFSVRVEGVKVEVFYKNDDKKLPPTELVQDAQGNDTVSRVKRINFLFEQAMSKFSSTATNTTSSQKDVDLEDDDESQLPF